MLYRIPLFDIDWTLLKGGSVGNKIHHDAFDFALHNVYKEPTASKKELFGEGRIDPQILIEILKLHGVSENKAKAKISKAMKAMAQYFKQHADNGTFELMPGVLDLLSDLKARNILMGLLTGNVEEIGREKLKRAGIADYFSFGAFGSMAFKRVDLVSIAQQKVSEVLNKNISIKRLVIIGDSPLDIACARDAGIPIIAVAAGHFKTHELTAADLTVESLEEKEKILKFLNVI